MSSASPSNDSKTQKIKPPIPIRIAKPKTEKNATSNLTKTSSTPVDDLYCDPMEETSNEKKKNIPKKSPSSKNKGDNNEETKNEILKKNEENSVTHEKTNDEIETENNDEQETEMNDEKETEKNDKKETKKNEIEDQKKDFSPEIPQRAAIQNGNKELPAKIPPRKTIPQDSQAAEIPKKSNTLKVTNAQPFEEEGDEENEYDDGEVEIVEIKSRSNDKNFMKKIGKFGKHLSQRIKSPKSEYFRTSDSASNQYLDDSVSSLQAIKELDNTNEKKSEELKKDVKSSGQPTDNDEVEEDEVVVLDDNDIDNVYDDDESLHEFGGPSSLKLRGDKFSSFENKMGKLVKQLRIKKKIHNTLESVGHTEKCLSSDEYLKYFVNHIDQVMYENATNARKRFNTNALTLPIKTVRCRVSAMRHHNFIGMNYGERLTVLRDDEPDTYLVRNAQNEVGQVLRIFVEDEKKIRGAKSTFRHRRGKFVARKLQSSRFFTFL